MRASLLLATIVLLLATPARAETEADRREAATHYKLGRSLYDHRDFDIIHVTGDNRYQLFVNGTRVVWGPARGDLNHWRFETVDLVPYQKPGRNALAAVVWNFAQYAPEAQLTNQTGFLLQGDGDAERVVDTNASWKALRDEAYAPLPVTSATVGGYYAAGPGDQVDASRYPWNWERADFDDGAWSAAQALGPGAPRDARDGPNRWMLVPRTIPLMEEKAERLATVRLANGVTGEADHPARGATASRHRRVFRRSPRRLPSPRIPRRACSWISRT